MFFFSWNAVCEEPGAAIMEEGHQICPSMDWHSRSIAQFIDSSAVAVIGIQSLQ